MSDLVFPVIAVRDADRLNEIESDTRLSEDELPLYALVRELVRPIPIL